jgi:PAS domain S-box-containing protein
MPENASLLKSIVETVIDGILTIDETGSIITVNPAAERLFGYSRDELVGQNIKMLMPDPYHDEHDSYLKSYVDTGIKKIIGIGREVRGRRKDGSVFPMELAVGETQTSHGQIFTGIVRDITERKQAEEQLRKERALLRAVVDTAVDAIITINERGIILTANPAVHTIFGYETEELIGQNVRILMPEPFRSEHDQYLTNFLETGVAKIIGIGREIEGRRKNGEIFPHELAIGKTETEDGLIFTGIVRDISERRKAEQLVRDNQRLEAEAMVRTNADLEAMVAERTAELANTNNELMAAKEFAETANMFKSTFLSRMSHELRTPMNAILGFGQLLELSDLDEDSRDSLSHILKAGRHLLNLINDVLDFSKVEIGEIGLSFEPVELLELIRECDSLMRTIAKDSGVTIKVRSRPSIYVMADRQKLRQVFLNIISNGIKYNHSGGSITISVSRGKDDFIETQFKDTGVGISKENMQKLFMPFERFGLGVTEGSGLGLSLSRTLTEAMGGTISASSKEGIGSRFVVSLKDAVREHDLESSEIPLPHARVWSSDSIKILVIEDNFTNVALLEKVFASRDEVELVVAMEGILGLELAQKHRPDVILLDVHLPDINGDEVLSKIMSDVSLKSIPVIIMSADAFTHRAEQLLALGAFRYVTKPFNLTDLMQKIDEALALKGDHHGE